MDTAAAATAAPASALAEPPTAPLHPASPQPLALDLLTRLLRDGDAVAHDLRSERTSAAWVAPLAGITALSAGVFGLAIGLPGGPLQALVSAVKLPLVMLGSAALSLPILHVAAATAPGGMTPARLSALVLQAMATAATTMAGLAPLALVLWLSLGLLPSADPAAAEWYAYRRFVLAVVAVGAVGGLFGVSRLLRELPVRAVFPWTVALGMGGLQLTWLVRPVIGSPGDFVLVRALESSGLAAILEAILASLGG